jgi:hypothetical protein
MATTGARSICPYTAGNFGQSKHAHSPVCITGDESCCGPKHMLHMIRMHRGYKFLSEKAKNCRLVLNATCLRRGSVRRASAFQKAR